MVRIIKPQDFVQRTLKADRSQFIPYTWLFLDTETLLTENDGITSHHFNIGWTCLWIRPRGRGHGHSDWIFHTDEQKFCEYIQFISRKLGNVILAGHNIFFDLQASGFYDRFTKWGWHLEFYYDQGLTYILKCRLKGAKITVVSTTNWFDHSLEKLGEHLKLPKGKVDFRNVSDSELKEYCRRDVEIIVRAIRYYIKFIVDHKLGKFSLTKASQAFTAYRHRFMDHKILIHDEHEIHELERSAYMGGRCECFFIGEVSGGPFITLDVNAMYPYVMRNNEYPYKLVGTYENLSIKKASEILISHAVIAEIEVSTPLAMFAVKHKGKTIFPIGRFTCFVCSMGLKEAIARKLVRKIKRASVYARANLFTGYVDYFHELRQRYKKEDNDIFLLLCKYMHNSLYGKFGQLAIKTDISEEDTGRGYFREDVFNMVTGHNVVITHFMNRQLVQYPEGEGENSNVAIAAHIIEDARFVLWNLIEKVGQDKVLYCDTDSVKIRQSDRHLLEDQIDPTKLGALKIENESNKLYIEGPKNYRTEKSRTIKGIPKKAVEVSPGVFTFESFVRQTTHLREGQISGARMKTITRSLKAPYSKGIVHLSGKVTPLVFPLY